MSTDLSCRISLNYTGRDIKHKAEIILDREVLRTQLIPVKDKTYIEREARTLGYAQPGEIIYQFTPPKEEDK